MDFRIVSEEYSHFNSKSMTSRLPVSRSDWCFGSEHDELLHQALERKRTAARATTVPHSPLTLPRAENIEELANRFRTIVESNFDNVFDCFRQLDSRGAGRLTKVDLRDGVRDLSQSLKSISESAFDELFDLIDTDKDGAITLTEFISFFKTKNFGTSRAIVTTATSGIMPVSTGLRLATARYDTIASKPERYSITADKALLNPKRKYTPFKMLAKSQIRPKQESTARSIDFDAKNQWIDKMMKDLAIPPQDTTAAINDSWDRFLSECALLDGSKRKMISCEGFRNALTRAYPKLSPTQIEWYLKDAEKTEMGDILYESYVAKRVQGRSPQPRDDIKTVYWEAYISAKLRINFTCTKQAFKHFDMDRDGRLSKREFVEMLKELHISFKSPKIVDEIFHRIDSASTGYIEYRDFLQRFKMVQMNSRDNNQLSDDDISSRLLEHHCNIAELFRAVDQDGDGIITCEDLCQALFDGNFINGVELERVAHYVANLDQDGIGLIDFRDFVRYFTNSKFFRFKTANSNVQKCIDHICERLRQKFDNSMQAFHAFDRKFNCRLSLDDFLEGAKKFVMDQSEDSSSKSLEDLRSVFAYVDSNGDGFLEYHDFINRFEIKKKHFILSSIESDVRGFLRSKFPESITDAAGP